MKRVSRLIYLFLLAGIIACQRETPFENAIAGGTLKSLTTGECLPATVSGLYKKDTILSVDNYIEVQAQIINTGNYTIYSDTINGFFFRSEGFAADTGLKNVRLMGKGTPSATGISNFSIRFGNTTCKVPVAVTQTTNNTSAIFTLGAAGANCTGVSLSGTYSAGLVMNSQNTIKVNVTVASIGTYNISTSTVNGVSFFSSGIFSSPGSQQVTLSATGTALNSGNFNYTINSGSSQCQFSVTYTVNTAPAVFNTNNISGQCTPVTINGTYKAGVPLNGNTIVVQVNVTAPGTYSVTTAPAVNGMVFNGAGTFNATGITNVTLYGIGTPLTTGTHNFTIAGANGCSFPLTTQSNGGTSTGIFTCKIDGVFTTFNIDAHVKLSFPQAGWGQAMELIGKASDATAENFYIAINKTQNGAPITTGNYGWGTSFNYLQFYYYTPTAAFWYGISTINMEYLTITTLSSTRAKGTFSGKVFGDGGWSNQFKVITEGVFDVPVQ